MSYYSAKHSISDAMIKSFHKRNYCYYNMKARYYICVGGKWMRVRLRVDGPVLVGQRARPVFLVRCGTKLCALPPVEVSRELGAHAAGAPSRARSGPTLSLLRHVRRRHQCRWRRRANDIAFQLAFSSGQWLPHAETWSVGVGTEDKEIVGLSNKKIIHSKRDIVSPKPNSARPSPQKLQSPEKVVTSKELPEIAPKRDVLSQVYISLKDTDNSPAPVTAVRKTPVKELVISGECVTIFGDWAVSDPMASLILGKVDEARFDQDPSYRNLLLYRLQPLVKLKRDSNLDDRLLRASQDKFAAVLGLIPTSRSTPVSEVSHSARPRRSVVRRVKKGNHSEEESPYLIKKPLREFSLLEDSAIVRWVCAQGAECRVNGNTIWKDLQPRYKELTGTQRSWHSLRNRYLRYILPSLPRLGLTSDLACRLRSAAARGELKLKSKDANKRRNSLLQKHIPAAMPSAHAAARKHRFRQLSSSTEDILPNSQTGKANSKKDGEPKQKTKVVERSPSYSTLTRAFAARHRPSRSTPSPVEAAPKPALGTSQRGTRRLYNPGRTL